MNNSEVTTDTGGEFQLYQSLKSAQSGTLIHQGAEARLYVTELYTSSTPRKCIVKERFVKRYRHPSLDSSLSIQRMRAEVRQLVHCRKLGIDVPPVLLVDVPSRRLWLGMIGPDALTLHDWFNQLAEQLICEPDEQGDTLNKVLRSRLGTRLQQLINSLGRLLARLHANHIVHGDLTLANILVRKATEAEEAGLAEPCLALVDFGLSSTLSHSSLLRLPEEKAVDLYVFERALINAINHRFLSLIAGDFPQFDSPENLMNCVLDAYRVHYPSQATSLRRESGGDDGLGHSKELLQTEVQTNISKLDEVRLRGRKRLMVG
ncbi:hypothetical protein P879_08194 [Paragonimus westermani]|uniref:non-specific serine/threonine protein kinase n=1 Tax=Paragonimus westermani TaxID=34504 RepID=A0A8T0CXU1_9TREM|nr:hypothetical protein P879_08194 [Paragonimus westermani]